MIRDPGVGKYLTGKPGAGGGFNANSAGKKTYGGGRSMPNLGASDPSGYAKRDSEQKVQQNNLLKRMQATQQGKLKSADALRPNPRFGRK